MSNMRRRARLLPKPPLPFSEQSFAEQDAAFYAAMKRGEACDARSVQILEDLVRWGAEQPAWFGAPAAQDGLSRCASSPSVSPLTGFNPSREKFCA